MIHEDHSGVSGENRASHFLRAKGFTILRRNYRFGQIGEIDIIARKGDLIIFVEVKNRSGNLYGGPLYSISARKKRTLRLIANQFILTEGRPLRHLTFRFDLIALQAGSIQWIRDIIR